MLLYPWLATGAGASTLRESFCHSLGAMGKPTTIINKSQVVHDLTARGQDNENSGSTGNMA